MNNNTLNNIYDIVDNTRELSYLPYGNQRKLLPYLCIGPLLLILSWVGYSTGIFPEWLIVIIFFVGGWIFIQGLFERIIQTRIRLVFDKTNHVIIKRTWIGRRKRLASFDDIRTVITETEYGGERYCLAFKGDMFGKNIPVSNYFRKNKSSVERVVFEEKVMPLLMVALEIKY